jgi:hypothetical protein
MAILHDAIIALNPSIVSVVDDNGTENIAYDKNGQIVQYDMAQAKIKLEEMKAEEAIKEQAAKDVYASALAKLAALGLTQDEVKALVD